MSIMTLVEFQKRTRDKLLAGVVEDIYTTNPWYAFCPWMGYAGNGITVNRENTLGDADFFARGATITAKTPSVVDQVTFRATKVIGDAEIDNLDIAESGSDINDIAAIEISSKAKSVGRKIQGGIATGSGTSPAMNSLHSLIDSGQYTTSNGVGGAVLTFDMLDELISLVKSKDGQVDWLMMNGREMLKFRSLMRGLGGVPMMEVKMGNRTIQLLEYNGTPVFRNDWLSTTETDDGAALTGGAQSSIYAGNFDDGSRKVGLSLIYPEAIPVGTVVETIGAKEDKDEQVFRVKSYTNLATFNKRSVARLTGIAVS